jgi:hypothetical protein
LKPISAASDTPGNKFLPWHQSPGKTFEFEYLHELETESENELGCDSGVRMEMFMKKQTPKKFVLLTI